MFFSRKGAFCPARQEGASKACIVKSHHVVWGESFICSTTTDRKFMSTHILSSPAFFFPKPPFPTSVRHLVLRTWRDRLSPLPRPAHDALAPRAAWLPVVTAVEAFLEEARLLKELSRRLSLVLDFVDVGKEKDTAVGQLVGPPHAACTATVRAAYWSGLVHGTQRRSTSLPKQQQSAIMRSVLPPAL